MSGLPESDLAAAVLLRAIEDAKGMACTALEQAQARIFLTAEAGEWAQARALWCQAAGLDDAAVRERMEHAFGMAAPPEPRPEPARKRGKRQTAAPKAAVLATVVDKLPRGVVRLKGRYGACASLNGRTRYIGTFDTAGEAGKAYVAFRAAHPARARVSL